MREKPALFVEQRECFQLPLVASSCDLPSWRCSLLEITLSFQSAQSVLFWGGDHCTGLKEAILEWYGHCCRQCIEPRSGHESA